MTLLPDRISPYYGVTSTLSLVIGVGAGSGVRSFTTLLRASLSNVRSSLLSPGKLAAPLENVTVR